MLERIIQTGGKNKNKSRMPLHVIRGINLSKRMGRTLALEHPEIAELYRQGKTLQEIAKQYLPEDYDKSQSVVANAVYESLKELIEEKELKEIGKQHRKKSAHEKGRKGGITTYERGVGCFGISEEEKKRASRKGGKKGGTIAGKRNYEAGLGIANLTHEQLAEIGRRVAEERGTEGSIELGKLSARARGYAPYHDIARETIYGKLHEDEYITKLKQMGTLTWTEITERVNRFFGNNRSSHGLQAAYSKLKGEKIIK